MAAEKILHASYNGLQEYIHLDPERPNDLIIESVQDCQPIIDAVKIARDRPVGKEWRHVASIPMHFVEQSVREGWLHDKARWHRWLNDPDNAAFRVWNGRMGTSKQI